MSLNQIYEEKLQAQLEKWSSEFAELKAMARQAECGKNPEYKQAIEEIRIKQQVAREKFKALQQSGEEEREDLRTGFENAWLSFGESLKTVSSRLK